ncbi:MAG: SPOR domain-containing protein [Pseudoxanthomonas sp.]
MAARRNKTQARRNSGNGTPGWVWLIAGLVLGAAAFFIVPGLIKKDGDGFFRPQPNPDALPAQVADADAGADQIAPETSTAISQPDPKAEATAKETQYDFYTLLPGKEVQMSDAELAASAREEKAREARAQQVAAATTATSPAAIADPKPVSETPATVATATTTTAATTGATATASTIASASAAKDARYILQAGAFGASGDAESTKAKIALLGLSARVESAQIGGKTVYRVRMGPYGTASELAEAKQKLSSGGLPAMAIKAK